MPIRRLSATLLAFGAITAMAFVQAQESSTQPDRKQDNQSDRYEARRVTADSYKKGEGPTVKEAILKKLQKANEGEIELAKMAQQQTDNAELKQLAQTIVQDHQALNNELQQHLNEKSSSRTQSSRTDRTNRSDLNRDRADRDVAATRPKLRGGDNSDTQATVPPQLCEIGEQAHDNALQMTKEMLGNYQGQDFNMAFLGQQLVAHTMMLAELKAIQSTGPEELHEIAGKAISKVEGHLDRAKQLAKKLEDDRKTKQG